MHTVHQPPDIPPSAHRPQYPPPDDLAAIESAIAAWLTEQAQPWTV